MLELLRLTTSVYFLVTSKYYINSNFDLHMRQFPNFNLKNIHLFLIHSIKGTETNNLHNTPLLVFLLFKASTTPTITYLIFFPLHFTKTQFFLQQMNSSTWSYNGYARSCNFQYLKLKCNCNRFAEVKIANTARNPLKLFYSCKDGKCGFLDWAHPIGRGCNHTYNAENVGVIDDIIDGNKVIDSTFCVVNLVEINGYI